MNHQWGHGYIKRRITSEKKWLRDVMLVECSSISNVQPGSFNHLGTDVEANHLCPMFDEPGSIQSGSTSNVQDPFPLYGGKQTEHGWPIIVSIVHALSGVTFEVRSQRIVTGGDRCDVGGTHITTSFFFSVASSEKQHLELIRKLKDDQTDENK